jgi:membrane protein implicated in regulation of membrane protease activity
VPGESSRRTGNRAVGPWRATVLPPTELDRAAGSAQHSAPSAWRQFARYLLWQAPGWLVIAVALAWLALEFGLPSWLAILAAVANVAKDLLLFPVLRATLRPPASTRHVGAVGKAVEPLNPSGLVRVNGELWMARALASPVADGSPVVVHGAEGLTLIVTPPA